MLFVFAALLVLVAAQCNPSGNTYEADGYSFTFGSPVGDWVPGLINWAGKGVSFATWKQSTAVRWEVKEFGSTTGEFCDQTGAYNLEFFNGCDELRFTVIFDNCGDRREALQNPFDVVVVKDTDPCVTVGRSLNVQLQESEAAPRISGDATTYVFGESEYTLASVADQAVIVQRWRIADNQHEVEVVDLASYPAGFTCPGDQVGHYLHVSEWAEGCAVRFCGVEDECVARAQLLHNAPVNDFEGDRCSNDVKVPAADTAQCSDGRQWLQHPDDCVNQAVTGGCAFCKGVAMGEQTTWCLNRQGARCDDIFESPASQTFCNMEFECPASTASISIVVFICSLLALFFH